MDFEELMFQKLDMISDSQKSLKEDYKDLKDNQKSLKDDFNRCLDVLDDDFNRRIDVLDGNFNKRFDVLDGEIKTIKNNDLVHLDDKINNVEVGLRKDIHNLDKKIDKKINFHTLVISIVGLFLIVLQHFWI
jgi:hypothetical protein